MAIVKILAEDAVGQVGVVPRKVSILSTDDLATVTTAGYLNTHAFGFTFYPTDFIAMVYGYSVSSGNGTFTILTPSISNGLITLSAWVNGGNVLLPVTNNHVALFNGTTGQIYDDGIHLSDLNNKVIPMLDSTQIFPTVVGDVLTISDSAGSITSNNQFVSDYQLGHGLDNIIGHSAGTWAVTRAGAGDWVITKAAAADTTVTALDVTIPIRSAAGYGSEILSLDISYGIATANLNAHSAALYKVQYVNNQPNSITSVPLTGSLATAVQTNAYTTNLTITTPAFNNTSDTRYILEITVDAALTSAYAFYGVNVRYNKSIG